MHIVIADDLPTSAVALLRDVSDWTIDARPGRTAAQLATDLGDADALIVRSATKVDAALIAAAPKLRVIARAGTGVDNVDLGAANARGIVVMNAPGANSISVAELTMALLLASARSIAGADAAMKNGKWEKKKFAGVEVRGKTLGVIGLGRIGREVAARARAFGMVILAHDPFLPAHVAADLDTPLCELDDVCARADYLTLHLPSTPATRHLLNAERLAKCKPTMRVINTARGELIDEAALADAIEAGRIAGAALDVFEKEPPLDWRLAKLPQVLASPHIAASTAEAQEQVGVETVEAVRDFLRDGVIRNAVNMPSIPAEDFLRLRPYLTLAERLGALLAHLGVGHFNGLGVRSYGELGAGHNELVANAALAGLLNTHLSSGVTLVNARSVATDRGLEVIESRSSRPRDFTSLLSLKLLTSEGEHWVEGVVFGAAGPRVVLLEGVQIEVPLAGELLVIFNEDRPGVIGDVGTILGRHHVNIANFTLGRGEAGAVGVVQLDAPRDEAAAATDAAVEAALTEIRGLAAVRRAMLVSLGEK